jgi:multiple sugar transport system permease protein
LAQPPQLKAKNWAISEHGIHARGLKVILDQFGQGGEGQWEVVLAASVIATAPRLIIFLGQRYFVEGIATTGRKS